MSWEKLTRLGDGKQTTFRIKRREADGEIICRLIPNYWDFVKTATRCWNAFNQVFNYAFKLDIPFFSSGQLQDIIHIRFAIPSSWRCFTAKCTSPAEEELLPEKEQIFPENFCDK